eukprot:TRINITY_DN50212_c0_g1_i1.p2 TRINITY_DN50212_c0_g1~~TRINITY_DN50212_c0_g1_i1.p2  ORF type:complete len:206 (+),score=29.37 TRINITY_DN50212_c0_g1_i1:18-635(+)
MIRRPHRSILSSSSAASDVYKRQTQSTWESQAMIPKTANYWSNGCGRDSYIYTSNGGFAKRPCTSKIMRSNQQTVFKIQPQIPAKNLKYYSDGTGRDNYIQINEGGLSINSKTKQNRFLASLRFYERTPTVTRPEPDYFALRNSALPRQEFEKQSQLSRQQTDLVSRLSQPKQSQNPYDWPNFGLKKRNCYSSYFRRKEYPKQYI